MNNQTCLVTGSTLGIGKATAMQLARKGWHVVIHGRRESECQKVRDEIIKKTGNKNLEYVVADFSLMRDVERMAEDVKKRFPELKVLVNNAGTFSMERVITKEGIEFTWAVNYLSRFLLVSRLLDLLKKNAPSRIVDVAGAYHANGEIHFSDINLEKDYSFQKANSQAKLANVLFTYKLAHKLKGTNVTVNCLHPGFVNTGSILQAPGVSGFSKLMYKLMSIFSKSPEQGAETSVYLASSPEAEGVSGKYFIDRKETKSAPQTYDKKLQDKVWDFSEVMVKEALR